jgi:hypothetical protein
MIYKKIIRFFSVFILIAFIPFVLMGNEKLSISSHWTVNYLKKTDFVDFNYINSNYCVFYKIEVVNEKKEKKLIFICKDFEKKTVKNKKSNFNNKYYSRRVKQNINNSNCKIIDCQKSHDIGNLIYAFDNADYYETEIQKNGNKQLIVLCSAKNSDSNASKEEKVDKKSSEELKEEADKKLDKAITEVGIGVVEIGMGAVAISQGHLAGGAASCAAGAYEIKESIENFKEAKKLYDEAREEEEEKEDVE